MTNRVVFRLQPVRPYSLTRTAARFLRFPEIVDRFDGTTYRRLFHVRGRAVLVAVAQTGPPSRACLQAELMGPGARLEGAAPAAVRLIERTLGIQAPLRAFHAALGHDNLIGAAIRRERGLSVAGTSGPWEALVSTVFAQQVNLALAYRIRRDLAQHYGKHARIGRETWVGFPPPTRIARCTVSELRALGISKTKAETLLRLATAFQSRRLEDAKLATMSDADVIEQLTALKGIGRWTAETTLIRGLARPDVFPAGDLGVVQSIAKGLLGHKSRAAEAEMRAFAQRWQPYRTLALVYAYAELRWRRENPSGSSPQTRRKN